MSFFILCYNKTCDFMKKLFSKEAMTYYLMFISFFILALESNIYLDNLVDISTYNLDTIPLLI